MCSCTELLYSMLHSEKAFLKGLEDAWDIPLATTLKFITSLGKQCPTPVSFFQERTLKVSASVLQCPTRFWSCDFSQGHSFSGCSPGLKLISCCICHEDPPQAIPGQFRWDLAGLLPTTLQELLNLFTACTLGPQSLHLSRSFLNPHLTLGMSGA